MRNIVLDFWPPRAYIHVMFLLGQGEECESGIRDHRDQASELILANAVVSGKRGKRKNVYFCFGNFAIRIKALMGIYVYFCIPGRKGRSSKIKGLAEKMSTFVYFCIPFTLVAGWFRVESTG